MPQLPAVPTIAATVPGYQASVGFGLAAPAATPRDLVERISADVQEVMRDPAIQAKFLEPNLMQPILGGPDAFAAYLAGESTKWQKVIKDAGLKLE
jgi:tripartite-type tricarboxylate transporter receptor subunit TctC